MSQQPPGAPCPTRPTKKSFWSFNEAAIINARKSLASGSELDKVQLLDNIGTLYNFLSLNINKIRTTRTTLREFEKLTGTAVSSISGESILHKILKDHGWNGIRFHYSIHNPLDEMSLLQALGTLYLSKKHLTVTEDSSVIKSFVPDILTYALQSARADLISSYSAPSSSFAVARKGSGLFASKIAKKNRSNGPVSVKFYGTCMLVDISGFTKLSAALCTKGSAGLDDLHLAINGYLGRCVEIVYAHGGDVISFAGDALICIFSHQKSWKIKQQPQPGPNRTSNGSAAGSFPKGISVVSAMKAAASRALSLHDKESNVAGSKSHSISVSPIAPIRKESEFQVGETTDIAVDSAPPTVEGKESFNSASLECQNLCPNALAAVRCAMELKEHCTSTLTAHVAISCGHLTFTCLGGYNNKWTYIVLGECIEEISSCIDSAKSKQLVVTARVQEHVQREINILNKKGAGGEALDSTPLENGNYLVNTFRAPGFLECTGNDSFPSAPGDKVRNFNSASVDDEAGAVNTVGMGAIPTRSIKIRKSCESPTVVSQRLSRIPKTPRFIAELSLCTPQPVLDSLTSNNFSNISELREVTTMFLKLDSFDPKTMLEDISFLQAFVHAGQQILEEAGGFMRQFLVDDKGCVLIAMWGVPSFTFPNNCSRAIHASIALALKVKELGHRCSIGITTGSVFCGTVGSVMRRDYVGIGSTVNMSARLMGKAKGRILVDAETFLHLPISSRESLTVSEELFLKGIEGGIFAYQCPVDEKAIPLLDEVDDSDGRTDDAVILQKNVASIITEQLNLLAACEPNDLNQNGVSSYMSAGSSQNGYSVGIPSFGDLYNNESKDSVSSSGGDAIISKPSMGMFSFGNASRSEVAAKDLAKTPRHKRGLGVRHPMVSMSLIQGPSGSGKTTVASAFRRGAQTRGLRCVSLTARKGDEAKPHGTIGKLLMELIGTEELVNDTMQRVTLYNLMYALYPGANPAMLLAESKALREAFGYSWIVTDDPNNIGSLFGGGEHLLGSNGPSGVFSASSLGGRSVNDESIQVTQTHKHGGLTSFSQGAASFKRPIGTLSSFSGALGPSQRSRATLSTASPRSQNTRKVDSILEDLLLLLLQRTPTAIVICNAHLSDELSWRVLKRLLNLPLHLVIMVTILTKPVSSMLDEEYHKHNEMKDAAKMFGRKVLNQPSRATVMNLTMRYASNPVFHSVLAHPKVRSINLMPLNFEQVHHTLVRHRWKSLTSPLGAALSRLNPTQENDAPCGIAISSSPSLPEIEANVDPQITSDVVETVLEVSKGNAFWVRSIADFIAERGVDAFMNSTGSNDAITDSPQAALSSVKNCVVSPTADTTSGSVNQPGSAMQTRGGAVRFTGGLKRIASASNMIGADLEVDDRKNPLYVFVICRLEKLPPYLQTILKMASIIGPEFDSITLESILPKDISFNMAHSLEKLAESSFLYGIGDLDEIAPTYRFQNCLMRNALYVLTPPREAARVHQQVAEYIEEVFERELRPHYSALIYHYGASSGHNPKVVKYALDAAEDSLAQNSHAECLGYCNKAKSAVTATSEVHEILNLVELALAELEPRDPESSVSISGSSMSWDEDYLVNKFEALESLLLCQAIQLDAEIRKDRNIAEDMINEVGESTKITGIGSACGCFGSAFGAGNQYVEIVTADQTALRIPLKRYRKISCKGKQFAQISETTDFKPTESDAP